MMRISSSLRLSQIKVACFDSRISSFLSHPRLVNVQILDVLLQDNNGLPLPTHMCTSRSEKETTDPIFLYRLKAPIYPNYCLITTIV
jgi:hypothetical protein